ncbi:MAG TPA: DUF11 domain-containing protein, partial [Methanosarcina sp.]|nr:DUF11 domain-containing protein [Methanosarcina sp.]
SGKGPEGNVTKAGDVVSYQINVTNTGNSSLTNVKVTDSLLVNLTGPVESLNSDGILEVGETWTYTGTYIVTLEDMISNGGGDGFINNTVTVDCDQLDPKSDSEAVPIGDKTVEEIPGCIIDKVVIDVAGKGPEGNVTKPGDVISYQINVTNTGNVNLTNVNVTDSLIENLNGPIESLNNNGVLEVGETWTYTGNYTVTQEDIDSNGGGDGFIENKATVSCDQLESMSDSAEVPIEKEPIYEKPEYCIHKSVIGIDETGDCIINEPGDVIEYQIVVKNEGNVDLTGVKVTDPMITLTGPDGDHIDSGVLNKGETWRFYGNYTITQEDINTNGGGDGCIENKAIVSCNELPEESSIVNQPIILATDDDHHGNGGTGSAHIVSKPTKNTQVNKNTEEGSNTKIQIEADTEDAEQNNGNTETENEKEQEENENVSGFEVVYGIIGLLAIFLHKKK